MTKGGWECREEGRKVKREKGRSVGRKEERE